MTWSEKRSAIVRAIHEGRLDDAERLFGELQRMTREMTDPRFEADERFTEGLLRDAQSRFEEAEAAFAGALELDRRLRPTHPAVGESLHSLAIVRSNLGRHEDAVAAYRESVEIFRETRPLHVPRVLASIGQELLALERYDDALEAFEESEREARADEKVPRHDLARALVGSGEALRRSKQWVRAFSKLAQCTQLSTSAMWPKLAREMGAAWLALGVVSRYALQDAKEQAAYAFWFATIVGNDDDVKTKAVAQLESMPEQALVSGDASQLRVVFRDDAGNFHVASCADGLRHLRCASDFRIGDAVDVVEGHLVAADDPAKDPLVVIVRAAEGASSPDACRAALAGLEAAWNVSRHASTLLAVGEVSSDKRDIVCAAFACARLANEARPSRDPDVIAGLDALDGWLEGERTDAERAAARAKLDRCNGVRDVPLATWATYCALGVGASPAASAWYHASGAAGAAERAIRDRARVAAAVRVHLVCPTVDALIEAIGDGFTLP